MDYPAGGIRVFDSQLISYQALDVASWGAVNSCMYDVPVQHQYLHIKLGFDGEGANQ